MTRKAQLLFVLAFVVVTFGVGIVQALIETRKGETIQMLDLAEDMFVTPIRRANELASLYDTVSAGLARAAQAFPESPADSAEIDWSATEDALEEALAAVEDIRRKAGVVNRHVRVDTIGKFPVFGAVLVKLPLAYDNLVSQERVSNYFRKTDTLENAIKETLRRIRDIGDVQEARTAFDETIEHAKQYGASFGRRTILSAPVLAFEHFFMYTAFSRKYLRAWESDMEETSVFANTLRPPFQFFRYALLNDITDKAVDGRNGWLFYKPGIDYLHRPYIRDPRSIIVDPNYKPLVDNPLDVAVKFRDQLASRGVELLIVIVPGKGSIYPDMISEAIPASTAGTFSHSLRTIREFRELGLNVVDLFEPFGQERQNDSAAGDSLYLQTDTHWKVRGLMLAASTVAARVREYPWYDSSMETTEYVTDTITVNRQGDVGTMTALPNFRIRGLQMSFPVEPTLCRKVYTVRRDEDGNEISRVAYRDDFRQSKILLLGDSFSRIYQTDEPRSAGWIAHLAKELRQPLASIVSDGGASTLVRQTLSRRPEVLRGKKLVIWEFVERDLRFGAEGWQDVAL